jgi:hypothetical protein
VIYVPNLILRRRASSNSAFLAALPSTLEDECSASELSFWISPELRRKVSLGAKVDVWVARVDAVSLVWLTEDTLSFGNIAAEEHSSPVEDDAASLDCAADEGDETEAKVDRRVYGWASKRASLRL